ncbi:hypothetical protein FOMPIDRAFT_1122198 [Fomitopsis schrenkii]|uniref:C2H2-type domain-containing protein n=1 Tax=Fomitopsis schrenkii TaxID=2126942 RepID=S8FQI2_FOMSC|nr:hypothetical protein FOMPIDRAFT_1122198 [Fomitopsis schrenkii]
MARRLQEQLRADIERAQAEARAQAAQINQEASQTLHQTSNTPPQTLPCQTDEVVSLQELAQAKVTGNTHQRRNTAVILTMKAIVVLAEKNPLVRSTLASSVLPWDRGNQNVLDVFNQCISCKKVTKSMARDLSEAVILLAKSEALFASLRNSDAPAIQLDKGKRRWDAADGPGAHNESAQEPPLKRLALGQPDLRRQVSEAVRVVTEALSPLASNPTPIIHPHLIASIHLQLHQIFLFAVTSAPRAGERAAALQELAGLIQMLGVLSGIQIGSSNPTQPQPSSTGTPDIGTAVYPCLTCAKVFGRLFSLKAHQRVHLLVDRPFRCEVCVASFARNHDLKRHARLHEPRAYRCGGCGKVFSRRDAIKRHQDNRRGRGRGESDGVAESMCAYAEIEEVDKPEGEEEAVRRAKMWDGIAASSGAIGGAPPLYAGLSGPDDVPEEGEMHPAFVLEAQSIALGVHPLLHGYVTKVLGHAPVLQNPVQAHLTQQAAAPPAHAPDPAGPPTLASIIAMANAQTEGGQGPVANSTQSLVQADAPAAPSTLSSVLSLSEEQTRLLEQAIAQAALAAQAQAEAEAALEEEDEGTDDEDEDEDEEE